MAESEHDKRVEAKIAPKLANQRQREFLSKPLGGPGLPHPDQNFIDANHDPKTTDAEIRHKGHRGVWQEDLDKDKNRERAEEIASKMEGRPEQKERPKESILDRLKRAADGLNIGDRGQGKDKDDPSYGR